jgi:hypothetical protein
MAELGGSPGRRCCSQWEVARLRPSRHGLARDGLPLCRSSEKVATVVRWKPGNVKHGNALFRRPVV